MPLPSPRPNETEPDFINRCMGDPVMVEDYDDPEQRRAVCQTQWERKEEQAPMSNTATMNRSHFWQFAPRAWLRSNVTGPPCRTAGASGRRTAEC